MKQEKVLTRVERMDKERKRLTKICECLTDIKQQATVKMIDNLAFFVVMTEDLRNSMLENGYTSDYQNGENQWGTKQSPDVSSYLSAIDKYIKLQKQLLDLLPEDKREQATLGIKEFM